MATVAGIAATACSAAGKAVDVPDLAGLRTADPRSGLIRLSEVGRAGLFRWQAGDYRTAIASDPLGGRYIAARSTSASLGAWVRQGNLLTPEMFGATPIQQDHSKQLCALFDQIGPGIRIELNGRYILARGITIARKSNFRITGTGSIVMRSGTPVTYDHGMLFFVECSDFELATLTCDANRVARIPREVPAHSLTFQSCRRFRCIGVRSVNAVCDGFILFSATPERFDTHCRDFQFIDCVADNCFRQGCSVIQGHAGVFRGGAFSNTNGTAPAAGIDLESDAGAPNGSISDIMVDRVRFIGNQGFGLLVSTVSRPRDIVATDCVFDDNRRGAISWGSARGHIIRPRISGFGPDAERGAIDIPAGDGWRTDEPIKIETPKFTRVTTPRADTPLIYVHAAAYAPAVITQMTADACGGIAGLNRDGSHLSAAVVLASLGRVDGAISVSGRACTVADNRVDRFFGSAIIVTGSDATVEANTLTEPRFNDINGTIRILASGAKVVNNIIKAKQAMVGIRVAGPIRLLGGNRITGFGRSVAAVATESGS
ncbi:hypothetical protein MC45_17680 (plasmid) [Sphingomonas taxi]|uniref:Right handed beta helix domain-containing protein n=1 Tax=Sphingomonas taxi TaxID=1549858 RepID=A0A097ELC4_9SPHN|nr:hypothetical protein [Sphingomonas taxi]AIT08374.1 hypothetical protein MC45_17680 [Sphingomonas taxi]